MGYIFSEHIKLINYGTDERPEFDSLKGYMFNLFFPPRLHRHRDPPSLLSEGSMTDNRDLNPRCPKYEAVILVTAAEI
jgi:hypothetical protein